MNHQEFLQSEIGQYVTARLDQDHSIQDIIADLTTPTLEIEEMLSISLATHCTPEELEQYPESDERYECTAHGRYLQSCMQYALDNVDYLNKIFA